MVEPEHNDVDQWLSKLAQFHRRLDGEWGRSSVGRAPQWHCGVAEIPTSSEFVGNPIVHGDERTLHARSVLSPLRGRVSPTVPGFSEAIDALLKAKEAAKRRPEYLTSLRQYLRQFSRGRESLSVASVNTQMVEEWFASRTEAPSTMASNVGRLRALFSFCLRRRWIHENPCEFLERIHVEQRPPKILTPEQCETLMRFVEQHERDCLAWYAACLFAGVRPSEAQRLHWSAFTPGRLTVDAAASKVRRRRVINLMPTADAWLSQAKKHDSRLPIPQITRRRSIRRVAEALGLPGWPQDILRHTCASYWLAKAQDCGRVAFELGNSPGILMRHYMQLVSREAAEAFWGIHPMR